MFKGIILLSFILFLFSCAEPYSTTTVTINNPTRYNIEIVPYKLGVVLVDKVKKINSGTSIEIEQYVGRGKNNIPVHFDPQFQNVDSINIIWDGIYKVNHLLDYFDIEDTSHTIPVFSERNIARTQDYKTTKTEKKYKLNWFLEYTFTEADYEYAKE